MVQWQIRRIEKGAGGKSTPGTFIAAITTADGSGRLTIHDPAYKKILKELFEEDQFIMMFADDEDGICSDAGQTFPPWHPKSLDYALGRLKRYRLMALEILRYIVFKIIDLARPEGGSFIPNTATTDNAAKLIILNVIATPDA